MVAGLSARMKVCIGADNEAAGLLGATTEMDVRIREIERSSCRLKGDSMSKDRRIAELEQELEAANRLAASLDAKLNSALSSVAVADLTRSQKAAYNGDGIAAVSEKIAPFPEPPSNAQPRMQQPQRELKQPQLQRPRTPPKMTRYVSPRQGAAVMSPTSSLRDLNREAPGVKTGEAAGLNPKTRSSITPTRRLITTSSNPAIGKVGVAGAQHSSQAAVPVGSRHMPPPRVNSYGANQSVATQYTPPGDLAARFGSAKNNTASPIQRLSPGQMPALLQSRLASAGVLR